MKIPTTPVVERDAKVSTISNPESDSRRDAWARWIASELPACSLDELRIIGVRVERLARARAKYGPLDLSSDKRDFRRERAEENVDRAFYTDCILIATQDEERDRLYCEAADEMARTHPIEKGLAELVENAPEPENWDGIETRFDVGGEAG